MSAPCEKCGRMGGRHNATCPDFAIRDEADVIEAIITAEEEQRRQRTPEGLLEDVRKEIKTYGTRAARVTVDFAEYPGSDALEFELPGKGGRYTCEVEPQPDFVDGRMLTYTQRYVPEVPAKRVRLVHGARQWGTTRERRIGIGQLVETALRLLLLTVLALLAAACEPAPCEQRYGYFLETYPAYHFDGAAVAPGIELDPGRNEIDFETLTASVQEVRECLGKDLGTVRVKIPDDWMMNEDGTEQVLPFATPDRYCKGKRASGEAPCRYRAFLQCEAPGCDGPMVIATPNMKLLKDALVRLTTGSTNPWADPALAPCATPHVRIDTAMMKVPDTHDGEPIEVKFEHDWSERQLADMPKEACLASGP